jgi:hypothetical protein
MNKNLVELARITVDRSFEWKRKDLIRRVKEFRGQFKDCLTGHMGGVCEVNHVMYHYVYDRYVLSGFHKLTQRYTDKDGYNHTIVFKGDRDLLRKLSRYWDISEQRPLLENIIFEIYLGWGKYAGKSHACNLPLAEYDIKKILEIL